MSSRYEDAESLLYGDLQGKVAVDPPTPSVSELMDKLQQLEKCCADLDNKLKKVTQERNDLLKYKRILERNISCLFRTAQLELERSREEISRLRSSRKRPLDYSTHRSTEKANPPISKRRLPDGNPQSLSGSITHVSTTSMSS